MTKPVKVLKRNIRILPGKRILRDLTGENKPCKRDCVCLNRERFRGSNHVRPFYHITQRTSMMI